MFNFDLIFQTKHITLFEIKIDLYREFVNKCDKLQVLILNEKIMAVCSITFVRTSFVIRYNSKVGVSAISRNYIIYSLIL